MNKCRVLVIGLNSFVAKSLISLYQDKIILTKCNYTDIHKINYSKFDVVINCAIHPLYKSEKYNIDNDIDYKLSELLNGTACHYIMLSSRKIYGNTKELTIFTETDPYNPFDFYSENKVITEKSLLSTLDNLTIIRGSNLFGFEYNRNSFLGYCMTNLVKYNNIICDINLKTQRDFIQVDDFTKILIEICIHKPIGIFNLGSNFGLEIGKICEYLIDGYGVGSFECSNDRFDQQFI